jgi:TPR repeat protein
MFDTTHSFSYSAPAPVSPYSATEDAEAYFELGLAYAAGIGEPVDYVRAHKWFNIAAMLGDARAREERADLAELMSPAEIADAQRLAREWVLSH